MRDYAKQPQPVSRTIESNPKATNQASISEILQRYKKSIVQPAGLEDEDELLQGKFSENTAQQTAIEEEEPLQPKSENKTGLPDNLKTGVENLSGYSMDDVRVHYNSDKPAQLNALAYVQRTDMHVAPGQEKHLPHEAWHVLQQKQGRVQPTTQLQGMNINDNEGLEKEADVMGKEATAKENISLKIFDKQEFSPISISDKIPLQRKVNYVDGFKDATNYSFRQGTRFFVDGEHNDGVIIQNVKLKIAKLINNESWVGELENYWEGWLVKDDQVLIPYTENGTSYTHIYHNKMDHDTFYYDLTYAEENVTAAKVEWETVIYWVSTKNQEHVLEHMNIGKVQSAGGLFSSYQDPTDGVEKEYIGRRYVTSTELTRSESSSEEDSE